MNEKLRLWQVGILIILVGSLLNAFLIYAGIGGLIRELMRLTIFTGIGLLIFGLIKKK